MLTTDFTPSPLMSQTTSVSGNQFFKGEVPLWNSACGTPDIVRFEDGNCPDSWAYPIQNPYYVRMGASGIEEGPNYNEGIFTEFEFIENPYLSYCLEFEAAISDCSPVSDPSGHLILRAANGKSNNTASIFNTTNTDFIDDIEISSTTINTFNVENYEPDDNYNQLVMYAEIFTGFTQIRLENLAVNCNTSNLNSILIETPSGCGFTHKFTPIFNDEEQCGRNESFNWVIRNESNDVIETSSQESFTHIFEETGTYEICLNYTDCYGCCAQRCQNFIVRKTIPVDYTHLDATGGVTLSSLMGVPMDNTFNSPKWFVTGNLIISATTVLNFGQILMDEGAKITVNPGIRFNINETLIEAGCDIMWQGIFYSGTGRYSINTANIKDAETAVNITGSASLSIIDSGFDRNWVCVRADNAALPLFNCYGNTFEYTTGMLSAYDGQLNYDNNMSYAAIYGTHIDEIRVDGTFGRNYIKNMKNGILARYSGLYATLNDFIDFSSDVNGENGNAIKMFEFNTNAKIINNDFSGGHYAINIHDFGSAKVEIVNNIISDFTNHSTSNAVFIDGGRFSGANSQILVDTNILNNVNFAINVEDIRFPESFFMRKNEINTNSKAIHIFNVRVKTLNAIVSHNEIEYTNTTASHPGFILQNLWAINFNENIIDMGSGTSHGRTGFGISNNIDCEFYNNLIETNSPFSLGFSIMASSDCKFECNYTTGNFSRGFRFLNPCRFSDFKTNVMTNNVQALRLQNATISDQPYKGNIFVGATSKAELADQSPAAENEFTYNNNNSMPITNGVWRPVTVVPNNFWWFNDDAKDNILCSDPPGQPQPLISELEDIVTGDIEENDYYDQNLWTSRLQLLSLLENDPSLMTNNTVLTNFYNNSSNVKTYYDFENNINDLYYATIQEANNLSTYFTNLNTKKTELDQILVLVNDNNFASYATAIDNKMAEINTVIGQINTVNATISQRGLTAAATLKSNLSSLPTPFDFCDDFKDVFLAKLDLELEGEEYVLTNHETTLSLLAELCPYETGNPVFMARGLNDALGISYTEDDESACSGSRLSNTLNTEVLNQVSLYPNPVQKMLILKDALSYEGIKIRDINGKELLQLVSHEFLGKDLTLDVTKMTEGIYFIYALDTKTGKTLISKFIKI